MRNSEESIRLSGNRHPTKWYVGHIYSFSRLRQQLAKAERGYLLIFVGTAAGKINDCRVDDVGSLQY